jgi:hypothetical protein
LVGVVIVDQSGEITDGRRVAIIGGACKGRKSMRRHAAVAWNELIGTGDKTEQVF